MPYQSDKQRNLMRAVAHSPSFAKKVGIPQSVGQKFEAHKAKGGALKESEMAESKKMAKKEISFMEKKGAPKSMIKHEKAEYGMKKGGKTARFASGGESFPGKEGYNPYAKGGMTKKFASGGESFPGKEGYNPYAKGGGVEVRGKTKGKMVKMMGGGSCK